MNWARLKSRVWFHAPDLAPWQKHTLTDLRRRVPKDKNLIWVLSSGTQSVRTVKAIGLTEEAVCASAESVNRHLRSDGKDRWLAAIPDYHVGGLGIYVRAHLSGAKVVPLLGRWSPRAFTETVARECITLTSLVPTQIHDLVSAGLRAPESLRAIVVGGAALQPWLYLQARTMGWPLLPSYGLTETCSQVATASLASLDRDSFPPLEVLSHAQIELREQRVFVRATSMTHLIATGSDGQFTLEDPRRDGWLPTEDLAEWQGRQLRIVGRRDSVVKILGVLVPVQEVEFEAGEFFRERDWHESFAVVPIDERRRGVRLVLVTDSQASLRHWLDHIEAFNASVPGVRRLAGPCWLPELARGGLGKIKRGELRALFAGG